MTASTTPAPLPLPWRRFVALGDSFTEGVGDPDPDAPGGNRGWADRVADVLAERVDDFAYANLAIRGRLLGRIIDEQVEPAIALQPDLVTISAGGNDVIRPNGDPDALARRLDPAVAALTATGATVVLFTCTDVGFAPVFRTIRGRVAIYNEHLREIAARHGAVVADLWSLRAAQRAEMYCPDRLHYNQYGHHEVARMVLATLHVPNDLVSMQPAPLVQQNWRHARAEDLHWAREYLGPWVLRRIRGTSSGDGIRPKRPTF